MKTLLRAPHWQIFLLAYGLPILLQIATFFLLMFPLLRGEEPDPMRFLTYFKFFPIIMILCMIGLVSWHWSVAIGLQKTLPKNLRMNTTLFKILFAVPIAYAIFFFLLIFSFINAASSGVTPNPTIFLMLIPAHLLIMVCVLYCLYFVAKTLKTAELQRDVTFSDFILEFILIWLFFVGVWIIQPKVNKLAERL